MTGGRERRRERVVCEYRYASVDGDSRRGVLCDRAVEVRGGREKKRAEAAQRERKRCGGEGSGAMGRRAASGERRGRRSRKPMVIV